MHQGVGKKICVVIPLEANFSEILNDIFIQENAFESVVWETTTILSRPHCVKNCADLPNFLVHVLFNDMTAYVCCVTWIILRHIAAFSVQLILFVRSNAQIFGSFFFVGLDKLLNK